MDTYIIEWKDGFKSSAQGNSPEDAIKEYNLKRCYSRRGSMRKLSSKKECLYKFQLKKVEWRKTESITHPWYRGHSLKTYAFKVISPLGEMKFDAHYCETDKKWRVPKEGEEDLEKKVFGSFYNYRLQLPSILAHSGLTAALHSGTFRSKLT